jgi:hypothetical protein
LFSLQSNPKPNKTQENPKPTSNKKNPRALSPPSQSINTGNLNILAISTSSNSECLERGAKNWQTDVLHIQYQELLTNSNGILYNFKRPSECRYTRLREFFVPEIKKHKERTKYGFSLLSIVWMRIRMRQAKRREIEYRKRARILWF